MVSIFFVVFFSMFSLIYITLNTDYKIGNIFVNNHLIVKILSPKRRTFNKL